MHSMPAVLNGQHEAILDVTVLYSQISAESDHNNALSDGRAEFGRRNGIPRRIATPGRNTIWPSQAREFRHASVGP